MIPQYIGLGLLFGLAVGLAIGAGWYMNRVFNGKKSGFDVLAPLERLLYRLGGIDPTQPMTWRQYAVAMLTINGLWLVYGLIVLLVQAAIPIWNQGNIPSMEWTLAINTAISFLTSTNLQHYSGESGATYFSQMAVLTFLQFVSAGTSLAVGVAVVRSLQAKTSSSVGNFYQDFLLSITRIFLPISLLSAVLLSFTGVPMTFEPYQVIKTLEGHEQTVTTGPVAAMLSIKHLGSNGGGFYGANTAHPFENPNFASYIINLIDVFLLPMAFVVFLGYFLNRRKLAVILFTVMTGCWLALTIPTIQQELGGNIAISQMGVDQSAGSLEGKEIRFGTLASAFWCGVNVVIPAGTLTSMHDSYTPLSGVFMLLGMQLDAFYGGVGTGFLYMFLYIILAIFIGSLMIGRTPELVGKKVSIPEIQIATFVIVILPFLYLAATAIAVVILDANPDIGWLSNGNARPAGYHGFTTMLYEYVSSAAGNGSGFEGLGDNTPFWNLSTAVVMLLGRFIPIIGPLAIGGLLYQKQYTPPTAGVLPTESWTFGLLLTAIIFIIGALSFFPALAIGPIAEFLTQGAKP
ncbi:potassium-transporting ATPase subunit KdpA [Spirosoma foliorum]|uniref:Potassium-transporting ATPase potassium-binding subunit n=1 Tax=Spirosoma foliorum TaxID=2710596 RepID=A0A7G5GN94_9BACT|nr:potassium-transporting ATPase subunit KdpA [Spirosoma foliorum]QMW00336.1 potassium-transporting ATPase subunit A [Spirosoma foliorum]